MTPPEDHSEMPDGFDGPRDGDFANFHQVPTKDTIPSPYAPWAPDIMDFALTFDAYQAFDGFDHVAELANTTAEEWLESGRLPESLIELRSCLFFEQRRYRHVDRDPDEVKMTYIRALVEAIRGCVVARHAGVTARR